MMIDTVLLARAAFEIIVNNAVDSSAEFLPLAILDILSTSHSIPPFALTIAARPPVNIESKKISNCPEKPAKMFWQSSSPLYQPVAIPIPPAKTIPSVNTTNTLTPHRAAIKTNR